jgi:tRNA nucleotidyltransferase (CCA-adding enzyme)
LVRIEMKLYVVGGAVRDELLGLPAADRDWVAVGATPQQLMDQGYRPVGKDFPVFLHPQTGEEVALARTERKVAAGYHGFTFHAAPEVTLEEDLRRRDLTINAIARAEDGTLIDPYGGQADLRVRVLRHVSPAFVEDPVRLLRVARLAARFTDFGIAPETLALLRQMVAQGEVDALVPERVWQELSRGLMSADPARMFAVLRDTGALQRLLPALDATWGDTAAAALMRCTHEAAELPVRWATLMRAVPEAEAVRSLSEHLRVSHEASDLALLAHREHTALERSAALDAAGVLALIERCDALRRPARFDALLQTCAAWQGDHSASAQARVRLPPWVAEAAAVDTAACAATAHAAGLKGPAVGEAIRAARVQRLAQALRGTDSASSPAKVSAPLSTSSSSPTSQPPNSAA